MYPANDHPLPGAQRTVSSPAFRIAPEVRGRVTGDSATVLDLRRGRYITLNPIGARIWPLLEAGHDRDAIVSRLAKSFPEQADRLGRDVDAFVDSLVDQGLLVCATTPTPEAMSRTTTPIADRHRPGRPSRDPSAQAPNDARPRKRSRPPGLLRCWATLAALDISIHVFGFPTLRRWIARRGTAPGVTMNTRDIAATRRQVDRAARAYFKRAWCLQRSAALVWLLRGRGVASDLVLGVRAIPFAAHAWSEVDGAVVNDEPEVRETYREIDRCRAAATGARS